jgi:hypothetical protein
MSIRLKLIGIVTVALLIPLLMALFYIRQLGERH